MARRIEVELVISGGGRFLSTTEQAASGINRIGSASVKAHADVTMMGRAFDYVKTIGSQAISTFAGFTAAQAVISLASRGIRTLRTEIVGLDDSLQQAVAIMPQVSNEMRGRMAQAARQLAVEFGYSATEIGKGFYYLASAGMNAEQSIAALPQVVAFAKAGMFDLDTATSLAVDTTTALGLRSQDAAKNLMNIKRVTDVITDAANLSNASVEQFAASLTNRGAAAARTYGLSIEQATAVLAGFADSGLKGRRAGIAMTIMLRELTNRAAEFKKLGVDVFNPDTGGLNDVGTILNQLRDRFASVTVQERTKLLTDAHLSYEGQQMIAQVLQQGDAIHRYEAALKNASGTTMTVAQKQMHSFASQIAVAKQQAIELGREGFDALMTFAAWLGSTFGPAGAQLANVFRDAGREARDFAAPLVALGVISARGGLEGLAKTLEVVGRFLHQNQLLVEIMVTAVGVRLVQAFVAAAAAQGRLIAMQIGSRAVDMYLGIAGAVQALIVDFRNATSWGERLRAVTSNPIGKAIGFTAVTLGVVGLIQQFRSARAEADKMVDSLTRTPTTAVGALDVYRQNVKALTGESRNLSHEAASTWNSPLHSLQQLGSQIADVALNVVGLDNVIKGSPVDQWMKQLAASRGIKDASDAMAELTGNIQEVQARLSRGNFDMPTAGGDLTKQFQDLLALADRAGVDITQPFDQWGDKLTDLARKTMGLSPAMQEANLAMANVSETANIGTKQIDAFKNALDRLFDVSFGLGDALDGVQSAMNQLTESATTTDKAGNKIRVSFSGATDESVRFRSSAREVAKSIGEAAQQMLANGDSVETIKGRFTLLRAEFVKTATDAGVPADKIAEIAKVIDTVEGRTIKVKTDDKDVDKTKKKTDAAKKSADEVGKKKIKPQADVDAQRFFDKIRSMNNQITLLNQRRIGPGVSAVPQAPGPRVGTAPAEQTPGSGTGNADGGVWQFADGGAYRRRPQPAHMVSTPTMLYGEAETGGESYIPHAASKRSTSVPVLRTTAHLMGFNVTPMAAGGVVVRNVPGAAVDIATRVYRYEEDSKQVREIEALVEHAKRVNANVDKFAVQLTRLYGGNLAQFAFTRAILNRDQPAHRDAPAPPPTWDQRIITEVANYMGRGVGRFGGIGFYANALKATPAFAGAAFMAGASNAPSPIDIKPGASAEDVASEQRRYAQDVQRQQEAIQAALRDTAKLYIEVRQAAGEGAANRLIHSGLVGEQLQEAAQRVIEEAKAREEALKAAQDRERAREDNMFEFHKMSTRRYLGVLHERLQGTQRYSDEWAAIMRRIQQVEQEAADKQRQLREQFTQPITQATSIVSTFGQRGGTGDAAVSFADVTGAYTHWITAVHEWGAVTRRLSYLGLRSDVLQQLMEAGPAALPLAKAILAEGRSGISTLNRQQASLLRQTRTVADFGTARFGRPTQPRDVTVQHKFGKLELDVKGLPHGVSVATVNRIVHDSVKHIAEALAQGVD